MHDLDKSPDQERSVARPEEPAPNRRSSGILPNRNSVLFWFAASGVVWIALAASAIWLV